MLLAQKNSGPSPKTINEAIRLFSGLGLVSITLSCNSSDLLLSSIVKFRRDTFVIIRRDPDRYDYFR